MRHIITIIPNVINVPIRPMSLLPTKIDNKKITPPKMRLSTKSFREMKDKEFRTKTTKPKF